jgi:hypothetical protein
LIGKTVTYKNFNDEEVTETFYFHLTKADLTELELSMNGGLTEAVKIMMTKQDAPSLIKAFKLVLKQAYGRRSEDGARFVKKDEWWDEFVSTNAYSDIFMTLVNDAAAAAEFIKGCLPKDLGDKVDASSGEPKEKKLSEYTRAELLDMPADKFSALVNKTKAGSLPKAALQVMMQRNDL